MLKITSISIIYYSFLQTFTVIFQVLGRANIPFWAMFAGIIIRTALVCLLVSQVNINIFGAIIANIIFLSIATIILAIIITKYFQLEYKLFNNLMKPGIIGFIVLLVVEIVHWCLSSIINYFFSMCISGLIGVSVYVVWIYFGKVFTRKELKFLSFNKVKLSKNNTKDRIELKSSG